MAVALLLAFGFGAIHALGPGHGKTLMAAYLVGAGGKVRHAIGVGGSVAVMHTASVLALGFVVLTATQVFAPERVYPWLGLGSGLVALALGASLLVIAARGVERSFARAAPTRIRTAIRTAPTRSAHGHARHARALRAGGWSPSRSPAASCRARRRSSCSSARWRSTGSPTGSR